jgi:hypothetical protein
MKVIGKTIAEVKAARGASRAVTQSEGHPETTG